MDFKEIQSNLNNKWIFRYRRSSSLSYKELMYNEIFFSYPDELNDPLDLGAEIFISKGSHFVYEFFLEGAFKSINIPRSKPVPEETQIVIKKISQEYSKNSINIKELLLKEHKYWLINQFKKLNFELEQSDRFFQNLTNSFLNIFPTNLLSVSFSKNCKNPLLWSVYGDKHQGFCKVFSPTDKTVKVKKAIRGKFEEYEYKKVKYSSDISVDVSLMFNKKKEFDYKELFNSYFPKLIEKALLTKNSNWYKEDEIRIHKKVNINFSNRFEHPERLTSIERTYHYDPLQLVGIIFGYKMKTNQRKEIAKIFESKRQSVIFFEAFPVGNNIEVECIERIVRG